MTELDLYKFIQENNIEWHWHEFLGGDDVIAFFYFFQIEEFAKILSKDVFDDEGIECVMKDGYLALQMKDICDYYGIEMENVFPKENKDETTSR